MTTPYRDVNTMLDSLLAEMQRILGPKLVGLYLYGSLVYGDFDPDVSDMDLLAVLSSDLDDEAFGALDKMQCKLVAQHPLWDDRIEIAYLSTHALKTFRAQSSTIGIISPGEPFHRIEAGADWLMNWYMVRETGVTLFGPSPTTLIDPIAKEEFIQAVREHAAAWADYVFEAHHRKAQAYAILTLCRALYTTRHGEQASKRQVALWATAEFPQWASLIQDALLWRETRLDDDVDHKATFGETLRFVQFAIGQISVS